MGLDRKCVALVEELTSGGRRGLPAVVRVATVADKLALTRRWAPALNAGPASWLDREWTWSELDTPDQLACGIDPLWLVLASETDELFGVLVVSGPAPLAALANQGRSTELYLWVEYLAISPFIRSDCPPHVRRVGRVKAVGTRLMQAAIEVSIERGAQGRIGLHAEGDGAVEADTRWKMCCLPKPARHPSDGNLYSIFIGDEGWANEFCRDMKPDAKGGS